MSFASEYLRNHAAHDPLFEENPDQNTGIIIVIPAFDEPEITEVLDSLKICTKPSCNIEVIVLLNAPADASRSQIKQNIISTGELQSWKERNSSCFFRLLFFNTGSVPDRDWGAGMARKLAMDEALRRFDTINRFDGTIASLDADCKVSENYLQKIEEELLNIKENNACSVYFEHPLRGELEPDIYRAVTEYELHMRYYYRMLGYTGYPSVFHTVGSCMAVKALNYCKAGGMNRRKGGEDFYFIQKLIPQGGYFYLNTATVYPSGRPSSRVPFGTGPVIKELVEGNSSYQSYHPHSFKDLKDFFEESASFFRKDTGLVSFPSISYAKGLMEFLDSIAWERAINEINDNTASLASFLKRFYTWFNMFRIVKYLNYVHAEGYFCKMTINEAAKECLRLTNLGDHSGASSSELLAFYRSLEKSQE